MKKMTVILICMAVLFSACKDQDDFMAYSDEKVVKKYFMRGDADWNIDEMTATIIDEDSYHVYAEYKRTNIGHVKFTSTDKMDWMYTNDTLNIQYTTLQSIKDCYWSYLGGDIEWNHHNLGQVVTVDKKKMVLFFPAHLNLYSTDHIIINKAIEFKFNLSKK